MNNLKNKLKDKPQRMTTALVAMTNTKKLEALKPLTVAA